jgi:hypothetical protein
MGRLWPSPGSKDWVSDNESGGGGGGGDGVNAARAAWAGGNEGLSSSSEETGDGDLSCVGWCTNQPLLCSASDAPRRRVDDA